MTDTIATPFGAAAPTSESRHRADVARLTLQLRQALAEAEAAEGQIALAQQTACSELRRRLDELQEQRRAVLDAEVARREAAGTAAIAAAQRQVDDMLAAGSQVTVANPFAPPIAAGLVVLQPSPGAPLQPSAVVIDIDTLARVCAMVVTEVLEQRYGGAVNVASYPVALPSGYIAVPATVDVTDAKPSTKGFWRNLMSLDVLLIVAAAAIVAVVLVAWLG
ncbi:MAG: hypothetical protein WCI22_04945 [Actinomycetota bacterium]